MVKEDELGVDNPEEAMLPIGQEEKAEFTEGILIGRGSHRLVEAGPAGEEEPGLSTFKAHILI